MLFNSFIFLFFLGLVVPLYYALPYHYRNTFLLFCSYIFYAYWDWRFLALIFISTGVDFWMGKKIFSAENPRRKKGVSADQYYLQPWYFGFF